MKTLNNFMTSFLDELNKLLKDEFTQWVLVPILIMVALVCFVNGMFSYDKPMNFFIYYLQGFVACGCAIMLLLYQRQDELE